MKVTTDDIRILYLLHPNAKRTSTQITKAIYGDKSIHQQRKLNSKVLYRLRSLEEAGLTSSAGKHWTVTNKILVGASRIIFSTDEDEISIGVGASMLLRIDNSYQIIKLGE